VGLLLVTTALYLSVVPVINENVCAHTGFVLSDTVLAANWVWSRNFMAVFVLWGACNKFTLTSYPESVSLQYTNSEIKCEYMIIHNDITEVQKPKNVKFQFLT
jgi:hypothetical protein